jgi:hypothetical protein
LWDGATPNPKLETRNGESPSDVINQKRLERSEVMERLERFERLERLELTASVVNGAKRWERLEHLERSSVCVRVAFSRRKNTL